MNNLDKINEIVFSHLVKTIPGLEDFNFCNNVLTYKGDSIILGAFNLEEFANQNGFVLSDISTIDLFKAIKIQTIIINKVIPPSKVNDDTTILSPVVIEGDFQKSEKGTKLIALDRFIVLTNANYLYTQKDKKEIEKFFEIILELFVYEDFLIPQVKKTFDLLKNLLITVETDSNKVSNYDYLMANFHSTVEISTQRKKYLFPIWEADKEWDWDYVPNAGFVDISIFLIVIADLGVAIAIFLLFLK